MPKYFANNAQQSVSKIDKMKHGFLSDNLLNGYTCMKWYCRSLVEPKVFSEDSTPKKQGCLHAKKWILQRFILSWNSNCFQKLSAFVVIFFLKMKMSVFHAHKVTTPTCPGSRDICECSIASCSTDCFQLKLRVSLMWKIPKACQRLMIKKYNSKINPWY